jgi:hypothetical protein
VAVAVNGARRAAFVRAAPMCSVISASRICCTTLSAISRKKPGSSSKISCAVPRPLYDDLWSSSLPFDRLTSNTNHLGGQWPSLLAAHQYTEVYGHNRHPQSL